MVFLAAWLGWGLDIFDGLLFNFVAPNAVPSLLGLTIGSPEAKSATLYWTGVVTSLLLIGWAIGGVAFGKVCDRIGRTRTLLLKMVLYSLGTFACAFAPNLSVLILCRLVASLGIGGEWAAGAAMVALLTWWSCNAFIPLVAAGLAKGAGIGAGASVRATQELVEHWKTTITSKSGSGFCYNAGRLLTAAGPFLVGTIASRQSDALAGAFQALRLVGVVPLVGLLLLPLVIETRGQTLAD
jgi:MFS family permease